MAIRRQSPKNPLTQNLAPSNLFREEQGRHRLNSNYIGDELSDGQDYDGYGSKPYKRQRVANNKPFMNQETMQELMKEMLFEFYNQRQEQLQSPRRFSPRFQPDYNKYRYANDYGGIQAKIRFNQFKNWFND